MARDRSRDDLERYLAEIDRATRPAWTSPETVEKSRRTARWIGGGGARRRRIARVVALAPGLAAQVEAGGLMPACYPFSLGMRVVGEEGALVLDTRFPDDGPPEESLLGYPAGGSPAPVALVGHDPYEFECRAFVACVRGEADPELRSADRALEALRVSVAVQRSLAAGAPVAP